MQSLSICALHNSGTLEPLTLTRVHPFHCFEHTLKCSHVLCHLNLTSVNIRHSNQSLEFVISYNILARFFTLLAFTVKNFKTLAFFKATIFFVIVLNCSLIKKARGKYCLFALKCIFRLLFFSLALFQWLWNCCFPILNEVIFRCDCNANSDRQQHTQHGR